MPRWNEEAAQRPNTLIDQRGSCYAVQTLGPAPTLWAQALPALEIL